MIHTWKIQAHNMARHAHKDLNALNQSSSKVCWNWPARCPFSWLSHVSRESTELKSETGTISGPSLERECLIQYKELWNCSCSYVSAVSGMQSKENSSLQTTVIWERGGERPDSEPWATHSWTELSTQGCLMVRYQEKFIWRHQKILRHKDQRTMRHVFGHYKWTHICKLKSTDQELKTDPPSSYLGGIESRIIPTTLYSLDKYLLMQWRCLFSTLDCGTLKAGVLFHYPLSEFS